MVVALLIGAFFLYRYLTPNKRHQEITDVELRAKTQSKGDIDDIELFERLGGGNFSDVYRGIMNGTLLVALKQLKGNVTTNFTEV